MLKDYIELCKPRVVILMLLTAMIGMFLSSPGSVPLHLLIFGLLGIGLCASSAAAINHLVDKRIDLLMIRTHNRPVATERILPQHALYFAFALCVCGTLILVLLVNTLTAVLTFLTLIGYAVIYTGYLKRATPQNIVIGGLAGAAPPLLGWTAITNCYDAHALLLVLIIFIWTPPHFWALAIDRVDDYKNAKIPMLPVAYGIKLTKLHILLYSILLAIVSILPYLFALSGVIYLLGVLLLNLRFLYLAIKLYRNNSHGLAMQVFYFSIKYLMYLFLLLLIDHWITLFERVVL